MIRPMALAGQPQADGLACPGCTRIDQVQRVSSIVEEGTSTSVHRGRGMIAGYAFLGRHNGGPMVAVNRMTTKGMQQTRLAGKLALPAAPAAFTQPTPITTVLAFVVGMAATLIGVMTLVCQFTLGASRGGFVWSGVLLAVGLGIVWIGHETPRGRRGEEERGRGGKAGAAMARWRWALATWPHLFYCHRCGGIYLPGLPTLYRLGAGIGYLERVVADAREAGLFGPERRAVSAGTVVTT